LISKDILRLRKKMARVRSVCFQLKRLVGDDVDLSQPFALTNKFCGQNCAQWRPTAAKSLFRFEKFPERKK
jgi:hypothetical protein